MKKNLTEADFNLGSMEAEKEEEYLKNTPLFLPTRQYEEITAKERVYLCGRKGTGKTAIAIMLEAETSSNYKYRKFIRGEAENYGSFIRIIEQAYDKKQEGFNIDISLIVRRLWLWILPVQAMQIVLNKSIEQEEKLDDEITAIKAYFDSLPPPLNEFCDIGHFLSNQFAKAMTILKEKDEIAFETYLLNLTATREYHEALKALRKKLSRDKVLIILDTIESYKIFYDYMVNVFQGILDTILTFGTDSRMNNIFLKMFMPAEVFDRVFSKYPGKVTGTAVFMRWRSADLISMISRRYLNVLEKTEAVERSELEKYEAMVQKAYRKKDGRELRKNFWYETHFLPRTIINRKGQEEDTFAYMFRHTQKRPREIITQMQSILEVARGKNEEFPYISADSVVTGVHDTRLLEIIVAEALTPYADKTVEGEVVLRLGVAVRDTLFRAPAVMTGLELKRLAKKIYAAASSSDVSPDEFVRILMFCGVVGILEEQPPRSRGDKVPYTKANFEYIMQGNIAFDNHLYYCIHPSFADLFKMNVPDEYGVIYPMPDRIEDTWLEGELKLL